MDWTCKKRFLCISIYSYTQTRTCRTLTERDAESQERTQINFTAFADQKANVLKTSCLFCWDKKKKDHKRIKMRLHSWSIFAYKLLEPSKSMRRETVFIFQRVHSSQKSSCNKDLMDLFLFPFLFFNQHVLQLI